MNKQEIFTKVKNHLLTQKQKSIDPIGGRCLYRGPNGLMCAVGCLIPDELYDPDMERNAYGYSFIDEFPEVGKLFDEGPVVDWDIVEFLRELQKIHDYVPVNDWKNQLQNFAIQENLEF